MGVASPEWDLLRSNAIEVARRAHAPWSGLRVGAAGLTELGTVVVGCNVENASFGLTLCAECGLVSALRSSGAHRLRGVSVVTGDGSPLAPCGRCRQLLIEHGGPEMELDAGAGRPPLALGDLLPGAFDAAELARRASRGGGPAPA